MRVAANPVSSGPVRGLYGITPDIPDTPSLLAKLEAAFEGGLRLLQYRSKTLEPIARLTQALAVSALCRQWAVTLIINDDPLLAQHTQAQGIHLGQQDLQRLGGAHPAAPPPALDSERSATHPGIPGLFQDSWIAGVSCHASLPQALQAQDQGAGYVAFGSMYPSRTKPQAATAPLSLLQQARSRLSIPIVAIGGITLENATPLLQAGADAIAVISGLFDAVDIRQRARDFQSLIS